MAQSRTLSINIEADLKNAQEALKRAQKELKGVGKSAKDASGGMSFLKRSAMDMTSQIKGMATGWIGVTAAITSLVKIGKESISLFMEQEKAENELAIAMKNAGTFTKEAFEEMKRYAGELQQVSTFGDEVTLSAQAMLQTYGMTTEELKRATRAAQDLAIAKKIDLKTASELVGKAYVGETGALSRYGIILGENIKDGEKFGAVLGQIQKRFGGSARAEIETYSGQLKQLSNWMGDVGESIGFVLIKAFEALLVVVGTVSTAFLNFFRIITQVGRLIPGIGGMFETADRKLAEWAKTTKDFTGKSWKMLTTNKKVAESVETRSRKEVEALKISQLSVQTKEEENKSLTKNIQAQILSLAQSKSGYQQYYKELESLRNQNLRSFQEAQNSIIATEKQTVEQRKRINGIVKDIAGDSAESALSEWEKYTRSAQSLDSEYTAAVKLGGQEKSDALLTYIDHVKKLSEEQESVKTGYPPDGVGIFSQSAIDRVREAQTEWEKSRNEITNTFQESADQAQKAMLLIDEAMASASDWVDYLSGNLKNLQGQLANLQGTVVIDIDDRVSAKLSRIKAELASISSAPVYSGRSTTQTTNNINITQTEVVQTSPFDGREDVREYIRDAL